MPEIIAVLENHNEFELLPDVWSKLLTITSATIVRLLTMESKRLKLKGQPGTKPDGILKNSIPIKTIADWNDTRPGFIEINLLGHDGGDLHVDYAQRLKAVDDGYRLDANPRC